jgi:hypothetical protein
MPEVEKADTLQSDQEDLPEAETDKQSPVKEKPEEPEE